MERATNRFGAERLAGIERLLAGFNSGGANLRVGRNGVVGLGADRDRRPAKPEIVEPFAPLGVELFIRLKDRDFNAVVPDALELLEDRHQAIVQVIGPQQ